MSEEVKSITTVGGYTRWDNYWNGQGYGNTGSQNVLGSVCGWVYESRWFDGTAALGNTVVHYQAEYKTVSVGNSVEVVGYRPNCLQSAYTMCCFCFRNMLKIKVIPFRSANKMNVMNNIRSAFCLPPSSDRVLGMADLARSTELSQPEVTPSTRTHPRYRARSPRNSVC